MAAEEKMPNEWKLIHSTNGNQKIMYSTWNRLSPSCFSFGCWTTGWCIYNNLINYCYRRAAVLYSLLAAKDSAHICIIKKASWILFQTWKWQYFGLICFLTEKTTTPNPKIFRTETLSFHLYILISDTPTTDLQWNSLSCIDLKTTWYPTVIVYKCQSNLLLLEKWIM